jgi:hypothetical protein
MSLLARSRSKLSQPLMLVTLVPAALPNPRPARLNPLRLSPETLKLRRLMSVSSPALTAEALPQSSSTNQFPVGRLDSAVLLPLGHKLFDPQIWRQHCLELHLSVLVLQLCQILLDRFWESVTESSTGGSETEGWALLGDEALEKAVDGGGGGGRGLVAAGIGLGRKTDQGGRNVG